MPGVILFATLSFMGLRSLHKSKVTTALDKSSLAGRVTGRIHYHGYGQPFVYLEIAEYCEDTTREPDPDEIAAVRQAGEEMMADFDALGRRWHLGPLLANLVIYLLISGSVVWILMVCTSFVMA